MLLSEKMNIINFLITDKMATLTPNQIAFILRSVGTFDLYTTQGKGHYGRGDFMTSFLSDWQTSVGQIASKMAIDYGLDYDESGNIVLNNTPSVDDVVTLVENVGMWIPLVYRGLSLYPIIYFQTYGKLYKGFKQARTPNVTEKYWGFNPGETPDERERTFGLNLSNMPLYKGNDFYLHSYLSIFLRDLFTDFDIIEQFASFITPVIDQIQSREQMIAYILQIQNPAGNFLEFFQTFPTGIRIQHTFNGETIEYVNGWDEYNRRYVSRDIEKMAYDGKLRFKGQILPHIGLYQMAFRLKPGYLGFISGMGRTAPKIYREIAADVYPYFLNQIRIAESRGEPKIRFSDDYKDFNIDLDQISGDNSLINDLSKLSI
jgi:hypothetical protein